MEKAQIIEFITALGIGGAISSFITAIAMRPKTKAETDAVRTELEITINRSALELVQNLRSEVVNMRERLANLEQANSDLMRENQALKDEVKTLKQHITTCENKIDAKS